jgi:hypothetical protein
MCLWTARRPPPSRRRAGGLGLFRRRRPLHERLARAGGLSSELDGGTAAPGLAAEVPGWDGLQRGEPGIHGVPRARRWDAVATASAEGIRGDTVTFAKLGAGAPIGAGEPEQALRALAAAVEESLAPPYRAEAVRRDGDLWAVGARRIQVAEVPGLAGEEAELVVRPDGVVLRVDGETTLRRAEGLEQVGAELGPERVVRAWRVVGNVWEVEATPL